MDVSFLVLTVIITALAFDFTNGFHDTANAMATVSITTGALKPKVAVLIAAVLNLAGAFLSTEVAKTISGGIVDDKLVTPAVIFGGLVGAILWNMLTWLIGLPSSSSHALFGGLIGAVWIAAGSGAVHFDTVTSKILLPPATRSPGRGLPSWPWWRPTSSYTITKGPMSRVRHPKVFRHGQTVSASMVALAHGTSDGQKTMWASSPWC